MERRAVCGVGLLRNVLTMTYNERRTDYIGLDSLLNMMGMLRYVAIC